MKRYFALLWIALRGEPGYCIVKTDEYSRLLDRVTKYERRAAGQRKANEARKGANKILRGEPSAPQSMATE